MYLGRKMSQFFVAVKRRDDETSVQMWTTNGTQADWMCLLANTSDGKPHLNKTLICVPMKAKGVHIERKLNKYGMRSSDTAEVRFEDVRVPQANRIGEEGKVGLQTHFWGTAGSLFFIWWLFFVPPRP